ncbi:MAG: HEAT repeat domain-containing protein [Myxococcales bacterium]|nr:HEAT repeat domain-containing protein [Myxococcales bacterium]
MSMSHQNRQKSVKSANHPPLQQKHDAPNFAHAHQALREGRIQPRRRKYQYANNRKARKRNKANELERIAQKEQHWAPAIEEAYKLLNEVERIFARQPRSDHKSWKLAHPEKHSKLWDKALDPWSGLLNHTKAWVRGFATNCLSRLPDPRVIPLLMQMCQDKAEKVRAKAYKALGKCGPYLLPVLPSLMQQYIHAYQGRRRLENLFVDAKEHIEPALVECFQQANLQQQNALLRVFYRCEVPIHGIFESLQAHLQEIPTRYPYLQGSSISIALSLFQRQGHQALHAIPCILQAMERFERYPIFWQGLHLIEALSPYNALYLDEITRLFLRVRERAIPKANIRTSYTTHFYHDGQEYEYQRQSRVDNLEHAFQRLLASWTKHGHTPSLSLWYESPQNPLWNAVSGQSHALHQQELLRLHRALEHLQEAPHSLTTLLSQALREAARSAPKESLLSSSAPRNIEETQIDQGTEAIEVNDPMGVDSSSDPIQEAESSEDRTLLQRVFDAFQEERHPWANHPYRCIRKQLALPSSLNTQWGGFNEFARHALYTLRSLHILTLQIQRVEQVSEQHLSCTYYKSLAESYTDPLFEDGAP